VITDLRLYKKENVTEFKFLTSLSLIYKIRRSNPSQRTMYFTSSNNFFELSTLLLGFEKNYKPQAVFIKQGVEMNMSFIRMLSNYVNLIKDLYLILKPEKKKNKPVHFNLIGDEGKFINEYHLLQEFLLNRRIKTGTIFITEDILVLDTNFIVFESNKETVLNFLIENREKIIIHESVYCDLLRIYRDERTQSDLRARCLFYINLLQLLNVSLNDFGMSDHDKRVRIQLEDENFDLKRLPDLKDWADNFLVELVLNNMEKKVLFISNDSIEGDSSTNEGPHRKLRRIIDEGEIKTITIKRPKQILDLWN
jgi:hypothetical protein